MAYARAQILENLSAKQTKAHLASSQPRSDLTDKSGIFVNNTVLLGLTQAASLTNIMAQQYDVFGYRSKLCGKPSGDEIQIFAFHGGRGGEAQLSLSHLGLKGFNVLDRPSILFYHAWIPGTKSPTCTTTDANTVLEKAHIRVISRDNFGQKPIAPSEIHNANFSALPLAKFNNTLAL